MYSRFVSAVTFLGVMFLGLGSAPVAAQGSKADYERAVARRSGPPAPSGTIRTIQIEGTSSFWYRRDGAGGREWFLVDADAGTRRPLFDSARVAGALAVQGGAAPGAEEPQIT